MWICFFTCITCAVYLELTLEMSGMFCWPWGAAQNISVRQCEAFKAVAKTLNEMMKQPDLTRYLAKVGIRWKFNLEETSCGIAYLNS